MNTKRKWSSYQAYVDSVVYHCLSEGIRKRDKIIDAIQVGRIFARNETDPTELTGLEAMDITQKNLIVAVSRTTSRKDSHGHRDIWCVPTKGDKPKVIRYVSLSRFDELTEAKASGNITAEGFSEFVQSREDLFRVADKQHAEIKNAAKFEKKLRDKATDAHSAVLDFGGVG